MPLLTPTMPPSALDGSAPPHCGYETSYVAGPALFCFGAACALIGRATARARATRATTRVRDMRSRLGGKPDTRAETAKAVTAGPPATTLPTNRPRSDPGSGGTDDTVRAARPAREQCQARYGGSRDPRPPRPGRAPRPPRGPPPP